MRQRHQSELSLPRMGLEKGTEEERRTCERARESESRSVEKEKTSGKQLPESQTLFFLPPSIESPSAAAAAAERRGRPTQKSSSFPMAFHPTYTPVPRRDDEKHRSKSPPPRVPKPTATAPLASASRHVPIHQALQHHSRPGIDGERPLAYSLDITGAAGGEEEGLGGEPFATYADDVRELVAALQGALNEGGGEAEEEQEGGDDEGGREEGDREGASSGKRLSEAVSVTRAFLHQQLRLAGDAERRSLAELRSAVKNLCLFEDGREGWRRRREAGGVGEEGGGGGGGDKEQPERLSEELKKEVRRGLESTLAVLLVEEEAAREKGLLH